MPLFVNKSNRRALDDDETCKAEDDSLYNDDNDAVVGSIGNEL